MYEALSERRLEESIQVTRTHRLAEAARGSDLRTLHDRMRQGGLLGHAPQVSIDGSDGSEAEVSDALPDRDLRAERLGEPLQT